MTNYSIFISSSDTYSDIWPIFFDMFYKYWPDFKGTIILNTETKTYKHNHFNIICTQVGKFNSFGKTFRAGLEKVESEVVMVMMVDCIFMGEVEKNKLDRCFHFFMENDLDSFCLMYSNSYRELRQTDVEGISMVVPPTKDMFTFQTAFWKKSMLYQMILPHENPWTSEWYGTQRANKMMIKLACPTTFEDNPLPYDARGCLGRGKWTKNAIEHLNNINYQVDFERRGYFIEPQLTIKYRLKAKYMFIRDGMRGSYRDLAKR